jgi:hypothetical protein
LFQIGGVAGRSAAPFNADSLVIEILNKKFLVPKAFGILFTSPGPDNYRETKMAVLTYAYLSLRSSDDGGEVNRKICLSALHRWVNRRACPTQGSWNF